MVVVAALFFPVLPRRHAEKVCLLNSWDTCDVMIVALMAWLNGPWYKRNTIIVYSSVIMDFLGLEEEPSDEAIRDGVIHIIVAVLFSGIPPLAMLARWTKLYGCCQHYWPGLAIHNIFGLCWAVAFDSKECDRILAASVRRETDGDALPAIADAAPDHGDDPLDEVDNISSSFKGYYNMYGEGAEVDTTAAADAADSPDKSREEFTKEMENRLGRASRSFRDEKLPFLVGMLTAFVRPFHFMTAWMLRMMHLRFIEPTKLRFSILLDIMWAPVSPATLVRQYFANMLCTPLRDGPLSCVLHEGDYTLDRINLLHHCILTADGSTAARFEHALEQRWPYRALCSIDVRRDDRPQIQSEVTHLRWCCGDVAGINTILRIMEATCGGRNVTFMRGPFISGLLETVARLADGAMDDVEIRHAWNRDDAASGLTPAHLTTCNYLRETASIYDAHTYEASKDASTIPDPLAAGDRCSSSDMVDDDGVKQAVHSRKFSAKHAMHFERTQGLNRNTITTGAWDITRRLWSDATDEVKAAYGELATLLNEGAALPGATRAANDTGASPVAIVPMAQADRVDIPSPFVSSSYGKLALPLLDGRTQPVSSVELAARTQTDATNSWRSRWQCKPCGQTQLLAIGDRSAPPAVGAVLDDRPGQDDNGNAPNADQSRDPGSADPGDLSNPTLRRANALPPDQTRRRRCQDVGACPLILGRERYRLFQTITSNTHAFLRACGSGHVTAEAISLVLLAFEGRSSLASDPLCSYVYWVAWANATPIFQVYLEMQHGGGLHAALPDWPSTVMPITQPHVEVLLEASDDFASMIGRLLMTRSSKAINIMAGDTVASHWRLQRLAYEPLCLTQPHQPLGKLMVTGSMPGTSHVDVSVPVPKPQAAPTPGPPKPKSKPVAKPKPAAKPAAAGPSGGRGRGRGAGRGRGGGGRGRGGCDGPPADAPVHIDEVPPVPPVGVLLRARLHADLQLTSPLHADLAPSAPPAEAPLHVDATPPTVPSGDGSLQGLAAPAPAAGAADGAVDCGDSQISDDEDMDGDDFINGMIDDQLKELVAGCDTQLQVLDRELAKFQPKDACDPVDPSLLVAWADDTTNKARLELAIMINNPSLFLRCLTRAGVHRTVS